MFNLLLDFAPWLLLGGVALFIAHQFGWNIRSAWLTAPRRKSQRQAARIRRTWPRLARNLGLHSLDHGQTKAQVKAKEKAAPNVLVPKIRTRHDEYGVIVSAKTIPGIGLKEWTDASRHLSDAWKAVRVSVTRPDPGTIRVRAVRRDPLTERSLYVDDGLVPADLRSVDIGRDEYADVVPLRLDGIAGIGVYGLPGYGKTSFILALICKLARHSAVQFVLLDGKSTDPKDGDYADMLPRFVLAAGDDLEEANEVLLGLVAFRRDRVAKVRKVYSTGNVWKGGHGGRPGFTNDWPLLILIVDECHTYFDKVADGGDKELKRRNALAAQNALLVQDLMKKGRAVGMITVLLTQKGTGDAIPTMIRDICTVSLAFASRTQEAAVAALGSDISQWPDANPVDLQDPMYIGVASMKVVGRPGYTRVRMPEVVDELAVAICRETQDLVPAIGGLLELGAGTIHEIEED